MTALDVVCRTCGAAPGRRCERLDAHGDTSPHPLRRKRAAEEQQRLNPEHVIGQLDLFPAKDARR